MIVCKPKTSTLLALSAFVLICLCLAGLVLWHGRDRVVQPFYYYLALTALLAIASGLTLRLLFGYKTILAHAGQLTVRQRWPLREKQFDLKNLANWEEEVIKTVNGEYRRLKLIFTKGQIEISQQEYDAYEKLKSYIRQKAAAKKR